LIVHATLRGALQYCIARLGRGPCGSIAARVGFDPELRGSAGSERVGARPLVRAVVRHRVGLYASAPFG
jgi:hypothetical protein